MDNNDLSLTDTPDPDDFSDLSPEGEAQLKLYFYEQQIRKRPQDADRLRKSGDYQSALNSYWVEANWDTPVDEEYDNFFSTYNFEKYFDKDGPFWVPPKKRMRTSPYLRDDDTMSEEMRKRFIPKAGTKFDISAITSIKFK